MSVGMFLKVLPFYCGQCQEEFKNQMELAVHIETSEKCREANK